MPNARFGIDNRKMEFLIHLGIWIILFFFPSFLLYRESQYDPHFLWVNFIQTSLYLGVFYLNYLWMIPRLFFRKKKIRYTILAVIVVLASTVIMETSHYYFFRSGPFPRESFKGGQSGSPGSEMPGGFPAKPPLEFKDNGVNPAGPGNQNAQFNPQKPYGIERPKRMKSWPIYNYMLITGLITGLALGLRFSQKLTQNEKKRKEAEKERLNTELAMLKNQINPHFLFNTLNSIYSLALMKSDQTAEAVMKLSDMMHYVIQDVNHELVPLETEIGYIRYYVELQKLRLSENVQVQLEVEGDPKPYQIPPMILIPFVENAFKYGVTTHESATILVRIGIRNKKLFFKISNQIFPGREKNETFGIGISNTRQRLQLIYPDRHELELTHNGKVYIVNLSIDLT